MLVLMRREDESFIIDERIIVTVTQISKNYVSIRVTEGEEQPVIMSGKVEDILSISENIKIKILLTNGRQARLGIDAPNNVSIYRKEVYMRMNKGNEEKGNA